MNLLRRRALQLLAGTALAPLARPAELRGLAKQTGIQLWTFREQAKRDLPGTLAMVRTLGFTDVELPGLMDRPAAEWRGALEQAKLKCSSIHRQWETLDKGVDSSIANALAVGAKTIVCPYIPHQGMFKQADVTDAAVQFNRWGRQIAKSNLQFAYHVHGYEFQPVGKETLFDQLMARTDPDNVRIQADVFWLLWASQDPTEFLQRYNKRVVSLHLKDLARNLAGDLTGSAPEAACVPLGEGKADWRAIFAVAKTAAIKHFYIEDESANPAQQAPRSLAFLQSLKA